MACRMRSGLAGLMLLVVCMMMLLPGSAWAAQPTFYVGNVKVEKPLVRVGDDVYVPAESIARLFKLVVKTIEKGEKGARVNGQDTPVQQLEQGGKTWFPILALARHLGWEVRVNRDLEIVDVSSPRAARMARTAVAELPPDPREEAIAAKGQQEVVRLYGAVSTDAALIERVERVGRRLVATCDRSSIRWRFFVIESKEIQAISVGGGRVFVTRGLLRLMDDTELAGAMAHEIGHGSRLHSTRVHDMADTGEYWLRVAEEARRKQQEIQAEYERSDGSFRNNCLMRYRAARREEQEALQRASAVAGRIQETTSRAGRWECEYEADRMGMMYLDRAGYHPMVMVSTLQALAKHVNARLDASLYQGLQASEVGSQSHPPLEARVQIATDVFRQYWGDRRSKR